jgi:hypothetical protein
MKILRIAANYLPTYEHGYNIRKTHQLVLGSSEVPSLDYLFPQTSHNKQHVLSHLAGSDNMLILNHPETMFFGSIGTCILGDWLLLSARLLTGQPPQHYGRRRLSWR